jgi:signal transduction histidine kinase
LREAIGDLDALLRAACAAAKAVRAGAPAASAFEALAAAADPADVEYLIGEIPRALGESAQGVERVAKIVRAMKEFSHPGTREAKDINLAQAVEATLTVSRSEWKYVAETVTEIPADLPSLHCNPGELNQVLLNLVVNAAHAIAERVGNSGEKGRITVGASCDDGHVEIRVADTGTGIPDHVVARMYEPFFTTKPVGKGTGQGLAIAYKVIQSHGGTIACDTAVGVGTTFRIRLPRQPQSADPVASVEERR